MVTPTISRSFRNAKQRAQALEIPVMMIQSSQLQQAMLQLGQQLSSNTQAQVIMAGNLSPLFKQVMQLVLSITDYVAVVNDAILASSLDQHVQWIEKSVLTPFNI